MTELDHQNSVSEDISSILEVSKIFMVSQIRFLMCAPDHYDVDYVINPWMEGNIHKSSRDRAVEQWNKLYDESNNK